MKKRYLLGALGLVLLGLGTSACSSQSENSSSKQTTTSKSKKSIEKTDENSSESTKRSGKDLSTGADTQANNSNTSSMLYFITSIVSVFSYGMIIWIIFIKNPTSILRKNTKIKVSGKKLDF